MSTRNNPRTKLGYDTMQLDRISITIDIVVTPHGGHRYATNNDRSNTQNFKDVIPIITKSR